MCILCALATKPASAKAPALSELLKTFKDPPSDAAFPERLRVAATIVGHWQIAVLMRLAAARIEGLTKS